jgi:hypothetical protein
LKKLRKKLKKVVDKELTTWYIKQVAAERQRRKLKRKQAEKLENTGNRTKLSLIRKLTTE